MKIPIDKIIIGERQRIDLGDLQELADSIRELGQINPITVELTLNGSFHLIAGRRRLGAATLLGWTEIEATTQSGLTDTIKQRIEYEEDTKRKDRTWQEKCIALAKLDFIMRRDKAREGEEWTSKNMASFTGIGRSSVKYMLQLAEMLTAVPLDEELWAEGVGYVDAMKICAGRNVKNAQAEMELRRQRLNVVPDTGYLLPGTPIKDCASEEQFFEKESPGQLLAETSAPSSTVIIQGYNMDFKDAIPGEDFMEEQYYLVLSYKTLPAHYPNMVKALRKDGCLVEWFDSVIPVTGNARILIWNKIKVPPSNYPFSENYSFGLFRHKHISTEPQPNPSGSVISCHQDDPLELPFGVVDFTIEACCPPNLAVLCPCNAPVVAVAQTGRIPIWFEADKTIFDKKYAELKEYYESVIPGVRVKMRGAL